MAQPQTGVAGLVLTVCETSPIVLVRAICSFAAIACSTRSRSFAENRCSASPPILDFLEFRVPFLEREEGLMVFYDLPQSPVHVLLGYVRLRVFGIKRRFVFPPDSAPSRQEAPPCRS
mgnify:CR=1 FL=1